MLLQLVYNDFEQAEGSGSRKDKEISLLIITRA